MSGDFLYLTTADGKSLYVPSEEVKFVVYGGFGAPDTTFITRRGYRQHGTTEVDYLLQPRKIAVQLWRSPACTRQQYWDNRLALHEFLRHNRNGPIKFVLREPNGNERALYVRAMPGLQFNMPSPETNDWGVNDTLDFTAFDPIWFDPAVSSLFVNSGAVGHLIFPITFPISFGGGFTVVSSTTITYPGTWLSYPTITLYGPYTSVVVDNATTGVSFSLTVTLAAGERRVVTLTPGAQSIVDGSGVNHMGDLAIGSDLVNFNLRPDPETPGGVQTIAALFNGGVIGQSAMEMSYFTRWFAL